MAFEAQCASNADREYLLKQKIIKKKKSRPTASVR